RRTTSSREIRLDLQQVHDGNLLRLRRQREQKAFKCIAIRWRSSERVCDMRRSAGSSSLPVSCWMSSCWKACCRCARRGRTPPSTLLTAIRRWKCSGELSRSCSCA
ncbi:hypothetical protein AAVH_36572, partial [Aphelenchoides avenae]